VADQILTWPLQHFFIRCLHIYNRKATNLQSFQCTLLCAAPPFAKSESFLTAFGDESRLKDCNQLLIAMLFKEQRMK
jgi:hypothetical protein